MSEPIAANPVIRNVETPAVIYRPASHGDLPLIYSDWLRSFRKHPMVFDVPNSIYFAKHKRVIISLMARANTVMIVNPDDTNQIYGWCVYRYIDEVLVIDYLFVKHTYRCLGLAKQLFNTLLPLPLNETMVLCSHTGKLFHQLKDRYHLVSDPYLLGE